MATTKGTVKKRARIVHQVRADFGSTYMVRKGWLYCICHCKGCGKMFQVSYAEPGLTFAVRQLEHHRHECRRI